MKEKDQTSWGEGGESAVHGIRKTKAELKKEEGPQEFSFIEKVSSNICSQFLFTGTTS